MGQLNDALADY